MPDILAIAEAGMRSSMQQLDVTSNNMANLNTQGYKREVYLNRGFEASLQNAAALGAAPTEQSHKAYDQRAAALKFTGSALHVSLEGEGYFQLRSPHGIVLTRNGQFQLDSTGQLVSAQGWPVLMSGGSNLPSGDFHVAADGTIKLEDGSITRFDVVAPSLQSMEALGGGLFRSVGGSAAPQSDVRFRQGYLEGSNVDSLKEMVTMMTAVRHMESSQQLVHAYEDMIGSAINTLGEF